VVVVVEEEKLEERVEAGSGGDKKICVHFYMHRGAR
jgi:hypothetical protein